MAISKKQYLLEGLCCGNCAAKIQNDIRLLNGIKNAEVNADTGILLLELDTDIETLVNDITNIAVSHDEDIVVKEI
ncbi:cation transporter [Clostridium sp. KNHs216]|uniref:heavy-metal-associated domain-containing protein n=1 Tax=Clostridium sp. KNHs216 TaxID=1550235 RepID=UPI00114E8D29|nr:cation transporter [Clostridium sp. KNHs216]TQI68355.1 Cd2+/Zn2+-exporting ATPase [Clostridium sp. KNHs216]